MTSIILGYDIGVMSGAAIFIKEDLKITDTQIEILLGILNLYSLVGSYAAGFTSDWIGRRYTIVLAAGFFFAGALLMGFATGYVFLMVGRFVAGIGVGYALMIAPVYTVEVAPASSRGFLTSFPEVFINIGILLGYVSNFAFSHLRTSIGWRFMLGVGAIPSVFLTVGVLAMPESPRWLVLRGRLREASRVLKMISDTPDEARLRLEEIKAAAGIPAECDDDCTVHRGSADLEKAVWKELLLRPTPAVRRMLLTAVGIHFFQQASGIDSVVLYSPRVFEKAGIREKNKLLETTVAVGFTKTLFILVATFLLDRVGRRPLLLGSTGGMLFSLLGLGIGLTLVDHGREAAVGLCVASILTYVAFFSIGMGPITWVYGSEILPLRVRAQGASIAVAVNRVTSGIITMTFISLYKAITIGGSFFLYAGVAAVAWVFFFTCLPETRGRTLEDIENLFAMGKDKEKAPADGDEMPAANSTSANATAQR
ncbi:polyol transporter 5-like [Zingiber officinale]|nr:polyol transporter 5-like [Zingiber officinale]XP_042449031.1 polyol transporter 5-like [Zingiber officinale]